MSEMKPLKREELYLNRLAGVEEQPLPDKPLTREELYYNRLCGGANEIPEKPLTRKELFLAKLNGEEVVTPEPLNRIEQYMAFATGETEDKPENPRTREEWYWDNYQGGAVPEEKTVSGNPIHVTDAVEETALALSVAFEPKQDGTPFVGDTTYEPYLSKTATTTGNKRYLDKIVGGTVAWNQIASLDLSKWQTSNVTANVSETQISIRPTVSISGAKKIQYELSVNHIYIASGYARRESALTTSSAAICILNSNNSVATTIKSDYSDEPYTDNFKYGIKIVKAESGQTFALRTVNSASTSNTLLFRDIQLIDLTLMFANAPAIADYIYSLEQSEAGAGVQWLKDYGFIDDTYRAYNAGQLISTKPEGIRYGSTTHAFGSPVELRGLYRLNTNTNELYCTGDELTPDGTKTTKWSLYDLGTRTWNATSTYFYCDISAKKDGVTNLICSKYPTSSSGDDKTIKGFSTASRIAIYDSSYSLSDVAAFKTAMSGVYVLVERTTPTTSTSETYPNPVDIENGDTEAFIDTRSIPLPVGNNSHYAGEYAVEGKTGLTVNHAQTQEDTPTTYSVTFTEQGTVYGGTVDIVTGALTITWGYIASYNGETLTGRWISSLDVYAEGATPTTGAEVAYELASPITAELTPQQVDMLLGENTVWTDGSESITLTYMSEAAKRVLAMNSKLSLNKQALEIKRNGGVIIDKPIIKPIDKGGLKL